VPELFQLAPMLHKLGSTELPMLEEDQPWKWLNKLFNDSASVGCANTASFNTV
jgi:hypothetical protein